MSGRKSDNVWNSFKKITVPGKTGCRAVCKVCEKEMQGLVERMKKHLDDCSKFLFFYTFIFYPLDSCLRKCVINYDSAVFASLIHAESMGLTTLTVDVSVDGDRPTSSTPSTPTQKWKRGPDDSIGSAGSTGTAITIPKRMRMEEFIIRTPASTKDAIDIQLAKFMFATNMPFHAVDYPEFKNLLNMLRPG